MWVSGQSHACRHLDEKIVSLSCSCVWFKSGQLPNGDVPIDCKVWLQGREQAMLPSQAELYRPLLP